MLESSNKIQSFWNEFQSHRSAGLIHDVPWFLLAALQHNQVLLKLILLKWEIVFHPFVRLESLPFLMETEVIFLTSFLSPQLPAPLHYWYYYLVRIVLCFQNLFFSPKLSHPFPFQTDKFKERIALLSSIINDFSFERVILLFCYNEDQRDTGSPLVFSSFQFWALKK